MSLTLALAAVQGQRGDLLLAPHAPGEIIMIHMDGQREWAIQKSSYMASDESVSIGVKTQGLAACCCSGEGLFVLRASGRGRLLVNSFGAIMRYDLKPGEVRIVAKCISARLNLLQSMIYVHVPCVNLCFRDCSVH